jgi:diazepam-binding inhibitor (GABA receptor modulating acyl-CoA-binding protein)
LSEDDEYELKSKFDDAIQRVNKLPNQPPEILLEMYGLYKQALEGDVTGKRPGRLNVKARYKFDAWVSRKGLSKEEAMKKYIELIDRLEGS